MSLLDPKEHHESSFKQNKTLFNYNIKTQNNQHLTGNILEENKQKNHTLKKSYVQELNCYLEMTSESLKDYFQNERINKIELLNKTNYDEIREDLQSSTQFSKKKRRFLSTENLKGLIKNHSNQENLKDLDCELYLKKCISLNNIISKKKIIHPFNQKYNSNQDKFQVVLSQESNHISSKNKRYISPAFKYKKNNLRIYIPNNITCGSEYENSSRILYSEFSTSSKKSFFSNFSQFSNKFTKNYFTKYITLKNSSDIYEVNCQLFTKDIRIKRLVNSILNKFGKINLKKNVFNFYPDEILALNLDPEIDIFIIKILNLFEKTDIPKKELIEKLNQEFPFRYEAFFLKILFMMMELKLIEGEKESIKEVILRQLNISNSLIKKNLYLLPDSKEDLKDNEIFIFSANTLLTLLGLELEDFEVYSFIDINLYFVIKLYIYTNDYLSALTELSILSEKENYYNNKSIFLYYFSNVIYRIAITNIEQIKSMNNHSDLTYTKITNIMKTYISLISNVKKKGKIYLYLSQLSLIYDDYDMFNFYILQSKYFLNSN